MKTREINIPFPGFYESSYSYAIDREEEMQAEWLAEREVEALEEKVKQREANQTAFSFADRTQVEIDESQCVTASEFSELFFDHTEYSKVYRKVAEFYTEAFEQWATDELELPAGSFSFAEMTSPREYNFQTDRIFATITDEAVQAMFSRSESDNHKTLAEVIRNRFTSYDGFMSHYPNDLESWLEKPLEDWDHNEVGTLLLACVELQGITRDKMECALYEHTFSGNGEESDAISAGFDQAGYDKALARAER
jgi:hypothetical protein